MKISRFEGESKSMLGKGRLAILFASFLFSFATLAKSKSQASLELSNAQYIRSSEVYFRDGANKAQTSLKLGYHGEFEKRSMRAQARIRDDIQAEEDNHHYIKPFDLNVGRDAEEFWFRVGRKTYEWSTSDEFWGLGTWQPRFCDDKLNRESGGFTGGFVGYKSDRFSAALHISPWYFPDMGADAEIKNNQFVSSNPWFRPPTSSLVLSGSQVDIRYTLDRPAEQQIIEHPMVAQQFEYRPAPTRFARLSSAFKPMNQLVLGGPLTLNFGPPDYANIDVKPRVIYHQVTTLEAGVSEESPWTTWASLTYEKIYNEKPPAEWISQKPRDATLASLYLGYKSPESLTEIYGSYLRVLGGNTDVESPFSLGDDLFEQRYMFLDAIKLGVRTSVSWLAKYRLKIDSNVTYDFAQHGILASLSLGQAISKYWTVLFSADAIGLLDESGREQNGFLSNYRANDRVGLGINYVF